MKAVVHCPDTGPLESLAVMLRYVGAECSVASNKLVDQLRRMDCDVVTTTDALVSSWGYERPFHLPEVDSLDSASVFVDIKGHKNFDKLRDRWPNLNVLWYRINGGEPEHVPGKGDEVDPPCPILTPNQWYRGWDLRHWNVRRDPETMLATCDTCGTGESGLNYEACKAYACWPLFHRFALYSSGRHPTQPPVCFVHNLDGWGYGKLVAPLRALGVRMHGVRSPDGLVNHSKVPKMLSEAMAYVHLKSSDAPGYALYEALAAACPVVCTRRLVWRCRMQELLIPGRTCLVFDRETHDELSDADALECTREVQVHLEQLKDADYNRTIGEAGREQLRRVMWSDPESLGRFLRRNFEW